LTEGGWAATEVPQDDGRVPSVWVSVPPRATAFQSSQVFATGLPLRETRWM
jgi:hypothetical protein